MYTTFIHAKIQISVGQLLKLCQPLIQYIMVLKVHVVIL